MPGRTYTENSVYRYGFNGKENDNEVKGLGNQQDYGQRFYDPQISRFPSADPLIYKYPMLTSYQFASNSPISAIDIDGLEGKQIFQYTKMSDGTAKLSKITYESTVIVAIGTKNSNFEKGDAEKVKEYLTEAFAGSHKDPTTGAAVEFKFNVIEKDFSFTTEKLHKDRSPKLDRSGLIKLKTINPDIPIMSTIRPLAQIVDNNIPTFPVVMQGEKNIPGTDGGIRTGFNIQIDFDSREGPVNATGHEYLHFLLIRYMGSDPNQEDYHHNLGGLLGRPIEGTLINDDILNKLKEYVPRASSEDTTVEQKN